MLAIRRQVRPIVPLAVLLAAVLGAGPPPAAARWVEVTPATGPAPDVRSQAGSVYDPLGHRMIVYGGRDGWHDIWALDLATYTWEDLTPSSGVLPPVRWTPVTIFDPVGYRVVMWSGQGAAIHDDTWSFDLATNTWTELIPGGAVPQARYGSAGVRDPRTGDLVTFAGFRGLSGRFEDTWRFDPVGAAWRIEQPPVNPGRRCLHSASYDSRGHRMIIYGGQRGGALDDVWAYDLAANTWADLTPEDRPAGRFHAAHVYDATRHVALVFGGNTNPARSDAVLAFDLSNRHWSTIVPDGAGPTARDGATAVWVPHEDRMVIFGGYDTALRNDVWSLEFADPAGFPFPDAVVADASRFAWPIAMNVRWVQGPLDAVGDYAVERGGTLTHAVALDEPFEPAPGEAWYYLFRPAGPAGSWQTGPAAEPRRDTDLPAD